MPDLTDKSHSEEPVVPHAPRLVFLGSLDAHEYGGGVADAEHLELERERLELGAVIPLVRRRSPWKRFQNAERVIVGSDTKRADVLLTGRGVLPEHIRFYLSVLGEPTVFRPLQADSTRLDGSRLQALEWFTARGGEEIEIGPWRFRYECETG